MTRDELEALLEQIPLPACVMQEMRISAANQRLVELTGHTGEKLLGAQNAIAAFVAPEDQARIFALRDARQRGEPAAVEYDFQGRAADGQKIAVRVRIADFPAAGAGAHLFIFTDERVRARSAAVIRGLVDVAVAAQKERTQSDFFRAVRERLLALGLTSTVLELEGDRFRIAPFAAAITKVGAEVRERLGGWTPLTRIPIDVTKAEGTLVEDLPGFLAALGQLPETAFVGRVPPRAVVAAIRIAGEPRYVISCSGEHLDGMVAGAFGLLGRQLGAALETTRRVEELDRRNTELSMLLELGQEVVGALDVKQVLQAAARTAARALRCSCAYVMLPNQARTALSIAAREDPDPPPEAQVGSELQLTQASLSTLAFQTMRPCSSSDTEADARIDPEVARRFRCRATLAVPLLSHGQPLGVLSLSERGDRSFDAQDVRLASHAAQLITAALENAGLYAEQRDRVEEMTLLNDALARTQKELIDRERMAALGELSASIAHEVRNPLGVIFNSVGSLRRLLKPQGDVALLLDIVGEEADRLNRMVADLLDYSRPVRPALQPVPIRPLIEEALAAARQQIGPAAEAVKAEVRVAGEAATVRADARLLRQALVNLFLNALQAMPRAGRLDIEATRVDHQGAHWARIAIHDTGPGIPPEAREKIFQPFFTTKPMGTGLGLAVVRRIVEGHGGAVELGKAPTGTEFLLRLPLDA